jgi:hypothetical protein
MFHRAPRLIALFAFVALFTCQAVALAQEEDPALKPPLADDKAGWVERGVLKVIPPAPLEGETFTDAYELYEIRKGLTGIDYTPNFEAKAQTVFERAKEATLRRSIWALEFSFKPVRMVMVDVPQPEGRMKRKMIWYLLYRVRNLGGHLEPLPEPAQSEDVRTRLVANELDDEGKKQAEREIEQFKVFGAKPVDELPKDAFPQVLFFPTISLQAHDLKKEYLDRLVPAAMPVIAKRERVGKPIYDSVTISRQKIEVTTADKDNSVWGVAMWEGVDPRIDFFSVYVQGLTNAYQFADKADDFKPGDKPAKGRTFTRKTLVLHFWRPGDTVAEDENEIRYGMPIEKEEAAQKEINVQYGQDDRLDYRWIYR